MSYPYAKRGEVTDTYFGTVVADPYRWMENASSKETLQFVKDENEYTEKWFADQQNISGLKLKDFIARQKKASDTNFFKSITEEGQYVYAILEHQGSCAFVKTDREFKNVEILLNRQILGGNINLFQADVNPVDPDLFLIWVLKDGAPRLSVLIYNKKTRTIEGDFDGCFSFCWSDDGKYLIYADSVLDRENNRNINRVQKYSLADKMTKQLYQYDKNSVYIEVEASEDGGIFAQVMLTYGDGLLIYLDDRDNATVLTDGKGVCNYVGMTEKWCYFVTDIDAQYSHLVRIPVADLHTELALKNCIQIVLEKEDAPLISCGMDGERIYGISQKDAVCAVEYFDLDGGYLGKVELPDVYGSLTVEKYLKSRNHIAYMDFESFLVPRSVLKLDMAAGTVTNIYQEKDPGDISKIHVKQQFLTARDGKQILAYLVYQEETKKPMPVMMYGYGGYAASMPPTFQNMVTGTDVVDWVRKGRMYVHCIIRGGSEYGVKWHEAGMLKNKKHVFEDFIDIAQWLVDQGWTTPQMITATGLSNGGLLMTAISTIRPDLFGTVIASVPHTDMLRFAQDDRGPMYITEYGNPMEEDMFAYMYSYSPYHNIKEGTVYPAMYVQTGECDNNVPPYHGKKFAARLQAEAAPENPILLRVLPEGSHDRGSGEYYYHTTAEMQMFIEANLKMNR